MVAFVRLVFPIRPSLRASDPGARPGHPPGRPVFQTRLPGATFCRPCRAVAPGSAREKFRGPAGSPRSGRLTCSPGRRALRPSPGSGAESGPGAPRRGAIRTRGGTGRASSDHSFSGSSAMEWKAKERLRRKPILGKQRATCFPSIRHNREEDWPTSCNDSPVARAPAGVPDFSQGSDATPSPWAMGQSPTVWARRLARPPGYNSISARICCL